MSGAHRSTTALRRSPSATARFSMPMAVVLAVSLISVLPQLLRGSPSASAQHEPVVAGSTARPGAGPSATTGTPFVGGTPRWPAPGTTELTATGARAARSALALATAPPATRVTATTFDRAATRKAGVQGVLVRLARADDRADAATVDVRLDYRPFQWAYGADWSTRLRAEILPECALTKPAFDQCAPQPVVSTNDTHDGTVTATVDLAGDRRQSTLLAVSAEPSGPAGDYSATPLTPSSTWSAGGNAGDFSWNYPMRVPPPPAGPTPSLALSYSSASVDGQMAASNNQPSWVGEGFDLTPGHIERRYRTCLDDKGPGANNSVDTGDQCWATDNATLSLEGHSGELIRDAGNPNRWHLRHDDGTLVERRFGAGNGARDGEYWVVRTTGGVQYRYGSNPAAQSTLTTQVYGNHGGEPCNTTTFAGSGCTQGWKWSLDSVEDLFGNTTSYRYEKETNKYGANKNTSNLVQYDRANHLRFIDYGSRTDLTDPAPAQVEFTVADRCLSDCGTKDATHWPDVPWDQQCVAAPCTVASPTFWSTKRLAQVTTRVRDGSSYRDVESWVLTQSFPDPGDGTRAGLWLDRISHRGHAGGAASMPDVSIAGVQLSNRVDAIDDSPAMNWWRIKTINNGSGGKLDVTYSPPDCVAGSRTPNPAALHDNTLRCYPVIWKPNGRTSSITDFFHKYAVTDVVEADLTGDGPMVRTHYDYRGAPAWHYTDDDGLIKPSSKTWSVWRGYDTVVTTKGEGRERTQSESRYFRGMHGDRTPSGPRSVTLPAVPANGAPPVADEDAFAGTIRETIVRNGPDGAEVSASVSEPWQSAATASRTIDGTTVHARFTSVTATFTRTALDGGRPSRTTTTRSAFDQYGMVTQADDSGDDAVAGDEKCTRTDYARNTSVWLLDRVSRQRVLGLPCSAAGGALTEDDVVSDTRTSYDNLAFGATPTKGSVTRTEALKSLTDNVSTYITTAQNRYDRYGRTVEAVDVRGARTTTEYRPATGAVTSTVATNTFGWTTTTTIDPAWGLSTAVVDVNGRRTDLHLDPLGRLVEVWLPGRDRATQMPSSTYEYLLRDNGAVAVTARTITPTGAYLAVHTLYDGLLRERQVQKPDPAGSRGAVVSDSLYDTAGRQALTRRPYLTDAAPGRDLFRPAGVIPAQETTTYDGAGRRVAQVFQVAASPASPGGEEKWRTTTRYGGDRVDVIPPAGGTVQSTITNAANLTTELRRYQPGVQPGPAVPQTGYDSTRYGYDHKGQLVTVTDPVGNLWRYGMNALGHKIDTTDPDRGRTVATYTDAGDLATAKDARGVTLAYTYDELGRRTSIREGSVTGPKRAEWTYDTLSNGTPARGHQVKSIRYSGTDTYVTETLGYSATYQPTSVRYTIPGGNFTYVYTYNPDGSPATTRLPAMGNLPTETLTFGYNAAGKAAALATTLGESYVTAVDYTSFAEIGALHLRNAGGNTVDVARTYETDTRRLHQIWTTKQAGTPTVADLRYSYDAAGTITKISDLAAGDHQCFRMDHLQRLTDAWSPHNGDCAAPPATGGLGGPAPYWQTFSYDAVGNRLTQVDRRNGAERTTRYVVEKGSHHVDSLSAVDSRLAGPARVTEVDHDPTGNVLSRQGPGGRQALTWDPEGRLATSTDSTGETSFVYDADGERLVRRDPGGRTIFLPGQELRINSAGSPATTRYYSIVDLVVAKRTAAGLTWLATDHQGTANVSVSATQNATVRRTMPFGEVREAQNWPGAKGFVGGTDDNTGLTHLGAREYDQASGRFISVDPIVDHQNPQQMNAYAYAYNSPVTTSDPAGTYACAPKNWDDLCPGQPPKDLPPPPSVDDQYGEADDLYFGQEPPGSSRKRLPGTKARAPGNGIIIFRFFISGQSAAFGYLLGDSRDFSVDADAPYRITLAWNTDTGDITYTISPSRHISPGLVIPGSREYGFDEFTHEEAAEPIDGGSNDVDIVKADKNFLDVKFSGINSILPGFEVNGEVQAKVHEGGIAISYEGDDYPDMEIVQYRPGMAPRDLGRDTMSPIGGLAAVPKVDGREKEWHNGVLVYSR